MYDEAILQVKHLRTWFKVPRGTVRAVDDVSFALKRGTTLGLVGESGCGKSTLGKTIACLIPSTEGEILFEGQNIAGFSRRELQPYRRQLQFIFQDPYASLNPRSCVRSILEEPLIVHKMGSRTERMKRIHWLMERVGIPPEALENFPHEFSGGQRQRIGIARALTLQPKLIICDEPVSALDVSVQAQVLNLLADIQKEMQLSSLFITHDFSVVKYIADRIIVMYLGKIVEIADSHVLWNEPLHPYTRALISAVPVADPKQAKARAVMPLSGEIPSQICPPSGCRFHPRCPSAIPRCACDEPQPVHISRSGYEDTLVSCHLYTE